jgi:signal transduction histidine kinase/CheY-like chemotaxis protein
VSETSPGRAMSVRTKLVLLTGLLLGSISAFIYLYLPGRAEERILRTVAAEARDISRIAAFSVAPALFFGDPTAGLELLKGADATTDVAYVVVVDRHGEVFAAIHEDVARAARYAESLLAGRSSPEVSIHRAAFPIFYEGERIGTLYAGLSLAPAHAEIESLRRTVAVVSAFVFLLGLVAAIAIGAFVTRPLSQMVETTKEIARGQWQRRAPLHSLDEVGELAHSFNTMLDALERAHNELEELNRNLEHRVADRTVELEQEILERWRGEDALGRANERFVLAAAAVNGAIYDWDIETNTVLWTDGITRVFGYPLEDVAPTIDWWTSRIHPEDVRRVEEQLRGDVEAGRDFVSEYRFRTSDQTDLHVWDRGRVLCDENGRAVRMVGIMESVTELKRLEDQFRQAQKMEAVGRLAGGIAHDFNNLLTTILGYSHLILERIESDDPLRPEVEEIRTAGERAAALTKQLLAFSRKQVIEPKVLEVNAVVANLDKMLRRLIGEDIQFQTELGSAGHIKADLGQLEQVIMNIAVNARDAMPRRGVLTIRTGSAVFDEAFIRQHVGARIGQYASIVVSDTGCGMDKVTKLRIFEPFFTTKDPSKGTGLGMAMVYGIVKQSEGYIWVDSEPGKGTSISVYFPRVQEEGLPLDPADAALALPGGSEIVLLVEDEDAVLSLVRGLLRSRGYTVLEASNAAEAVRISNDFIGPIHVLLTDVVMPEVSGRELADQLRQTRPDMRLIYMSGYTEDTVVHHGVRMSDAGFLQKPFTPDLLLRKMREMLDRPQDGMVM